MKYSEQLFGSSEWALRLPNLVLLAVYMIYCYRLFKNHNHWILAGMFLIMCTNIYLLDLFGLARGYGLSIGFMTMSIYHFIASFYNQKTRNILLFHLSSLLAILSSFILLDVYLALLLIYNLITFIDCKVLSHQKYHFWNSNKIHALPFLALTIVLYEPIRKVMLYSKLDFGGKTSFYADTATYLVNYSINTLPISNTGMSFFKIAFTCMIVGTFILIIQKLMTRDHRFWEGHKALIIVNLLFILIVIAISLQHVMFNSDYPIARFSIFLVPIFALHTGFLLSYIAKNYYKSVALAISGLASILSLTFVSKANLHSCFEWEYDSETKNMMQLLMDYHSSTNSNLKDASIGINWIFEPSINFYRQTKHITWLAPANRNGLSLSNAYFYCYKNDMEQLPSLQYTVIKEFPTTNTILIKNKNPEMP
jgi:hypothetical protein